MSRSPNESSFNSESLVQRRVILLLLARNRLGTHNQSLYIPRQNTQHLPIHPRPMHHSNEQKTNIVPLSAGLVPLSCVPIDVLHRQRLCRLICSLRFGTSSFYVYNISRVVYAIELLLLCRYSSQSAHHLLLTSRYRIRRPHNYASATPGPVREIDPMEILRPTYNTTSRPALWTDSAADLHQTATDPSSRCPVDDTVPSNSHRY